MSTKLKFFKINKTNLKIIRAYSLNYYVISQRKSMAHTRGSKSIRGAWSPEWNTFPIIRGPLQILGPGPDVDHVGAMSKSEK